MGNTCARITSISPDTAFNASTTCALDCATSLPVSFYAALGVSALGEILGKLGTYRYQFLTDFLNPYSTHFIYLYLRITRFDIRGIAG